MKKWNDIYKLPLHKSNAHSWVYDKKSHFVFQFETNNEAFEQNIIRILNGEVKSDCVYTYVYDIANVQIVEIHTRTPLLTIRGWGRLTGIGGYQFSEEEASNIQDTFAEWIVSKLNVTKE